MPLNSHEILAAHAAPYDIVTARNADMSESFDMLHTDMSGHTLKAWVSKTPGGDIDLTLVTSKTQTTKTYDAWIQDCLITEQDIPCGQTLDDNMTVTSITLSSAQTSIATLPRADVLGASTDYHWSLYATTPNQTLIAAGKFTLMETAS